MVECLIGEFALVFFCSFRYRNYATSLGSGELVEGICWWYRGGYAVASLLNMCCT